MVTLLNCIERIPEVLRTILAERETGFSALENYLKETDFLPDELVFIGSGTSSTAAITAKPFVEKVSGIRVKIVYPNEYAEDSAVLNPHALHVFTSQTGTSIVVNRVMEKIKEAGLLAVSFTERDDSPLAEISPCHISLNCGIEEYPMRTIGYTASVFNHMLLAMKLGRLTGHLSEGAYEALLRDAAKLPESHRIVTEQAKAWARGTEAQLNRSQCVVFTGADMLYGVSLEAAVKFWEMPKIVTIGYELEEGLHGPAYGYSGKHCVIVLTDGGKETDKAIRLARYMKEAHGNGLVIGTDTVDDTDLHIAPDAGPFNALALSAAVQVLSYYITEDNGRDLTKPSDHSVMDSYFRTHTGF